MAARLRIRWAYLVFVPIAAIADDWDSLIIYGYSDSGTASRAVTPDGSARIEFSWMSDRVDSLFPGIWQSLIHHRAERKRTLGWLTGERPGDSAVLSPDSSTVAYVGNQHGNADIYVVPYAGGEPENLTSHPAGDFRPAWSPDSRSLLFDSDRSGDWEIFALDLDDPGKPRNLTRSSSADDMGGLWSPTGRRVAFQRHTSGRMELWLMDPDGSAQIRLTELAGKHFEWSPDGSYIAYEVLAPLDSLEGDWDHRSQDIFVAAADGLGSTNVSRCEFPATVWRLEEAPVRVYGTMGHFVWSSDNRLAFIAYRDGQWDLFQSDAAGEHQMQLTDDLDVEDPKEWFSRRR